MSPLWALEDTAETNKSKFRQGHHNDEELKVRRTEEELGEWNGASWRKEGKGPTGNCLM